jgi:hypothetical protein
MKPRWEEKLYRATKLWIYWDAEGPQSVELIEKPAVPLAPFSTYNEVWKLWFSIDSIYLHGPGNIVSCRADRISRTDPS